MAKKRISKELSKALEAVENLNRRDANLFSAMLPNRGHYGNFADLLEHWGYAVPRTLAKARRSDG